MIDAYTSPTANCRRVTIMLEATGLPYRVIRLDRTKGEHRTPEYLALNPAAMVPAIVDHDDAGGPMPITQSGAILLYLAEKTGKFLPASGRDRVRTLEALMQVIGDVNPASSAYFHLHSQVEANEAARTYITERMQRYLGHSEQLLAGSPFLGGVELTIADFALLPVANRRRDWIRDWGYVRLLDWLDRLLARDDMRRGLEAA